MRDKDAQLMMEGMYKEEPGALEPSSAMRAEVDEYLTTAVHTTGAEDLKANVLAIIDKHLGAGDAADSYDFDSKYMKWRDDPRWGKPGGPEWDTNDLKN